MSLSLYAAPLSRELKPHRLVAATAVGNRLFLLTITANRRQWLKHEAELRTIQQSFLVPNAGYAIAPPSA